MKKIRTQSGFTAVEVVIVIVVLIVIGGVGWLVYDHNHKKTTPESSSTSSSQQTASTSKLKTATKPAKTADPYAGWKTYCDSSGNCFRYPSDMQERTYPNSQKIIPGSFRNQNYTLLVNSDEMTSNTCNITPCKYNIVSFNDMPSGNSSLKVVGMEFSPINGSFIPRYELIDSSLIQKDGLKIGSVSVTDKNGFTATSNSGKRYQLLTYAYPNSSGSYYTKAQADSWFSSSQGKTALNIVKSYYTK